MPSFFNEPTIVILISVIVVTAWIVVSARARAGWRSAAILSYGVFSLLCVYAAFRHDQSLLAVLLFALVAGFTELLADAWLVRNTNKLHYAPGEPFLAASPAYMPFSWAVILTQFAWIGGRISMYYGTGWGIAAAGVGGGLLIPLFEHCAKRAKWWTYSDWKHQWWDTPYFIMLGEALLAAALPVFMPYLKAPFSISVLLCGIGEGLWIWGAYYIAYKLLK